MTALISLLNVTSEKPQIYQSIARIYHVIFAIILGLFSILLCSVAFYICSQRTSIMSLVFILFTFMYIFLTTIACCTIQTKRYELQRLWRYTLLASIALHFIPCAAVTSSFESIINGLKDMEDHKTNSITSLFDVFLELDYLILGIMWFIMAVIVIGFVLSRYELPAKEATRFARGYYRERLQQQNEYWYHSSTTSPLFGNSLTEGLLDGDGNDGPIYDEFV